MFFLCPIFKRLQKKYNYKDCLEVNTIRYDYVTMNDCILLTRRRKDTVLPYFLLFIQMVDKYPETTFWLADYLNVNEPNVNQFPMQCFGYDGCYTHLYVHDNVLVCRDEPLSITMDTEINLPYCVIDKKLKLNTHTLNSSKNLLEDWLYTVTGRPILLNTSQISALVSLLEEVTENLSEDIEHTVKIKDKSYQVIHGTIKTLNQYQQLIDKYSCE